MSNQTGLRERANYEAFSRQWRDSAQREAEKWCSDEKAAQLLVDAVLMEFRKKFADRKPPMSLEYNIRAQVCLVYSLTGENVRKLENYIAEHSLPYEDEEAAPAPVPAAASPEAVRQPIRQEAAQQPAAPAAAAVSPAEPAAAPTPPAQAEPKAPSKESPASPEAPAAPEKRSDSPAVTGNGADSAKPKRPDTFLDPVRTTYWTPDGEHSEHVIAEIELPDEEEEERSVAISFMNTILFLLMIGAFVFCFYETGFLQYLLQ